jgi:hypothetical protein
LIYDGIKSMSTNPKSHLQVASPAPMAGYLLWLMAALGVGLFPQWVYRGHAVATTLPVMSMLMMGMVTFVLLAWPVRLMAYCRRTDWITALRQAGVDVALGAVLVIPFAVMAVFLGDGTWADAVRGGLSVLAVVPLAVLMGLIMGTCRPLTPWVLLTGMVFTLAWPGAVYVLREFFAVSPQMVSRAWQFSPLGFAYQQGLPAGKSPWPEPIWPALIYLGVAAAGGVICLALGRAESSAKPCQD